MAIDPSIALGVKPLEIANPLAQYGQIAQLQAAQNQNQLAQYQLESAKRQDLAQNALSSAYKSAFNPETGAVDNAMVLKSLANAGAGHMIPDVQAKLFKAEQEKAAFKKTTTETSGMEFKQRIDKANKAISDIAALNSPQEAMASIDQHLSNGDIDQQKADMLKGQLTEAPSFNAWQKGMLTNILDAKERLTMTAPKPTATNLGGKIVFLDLNPNSPTFQKEVVPAQTTTMTPGEIASNQATIRGQNLIDARARQRLEQEMATGTLTPQSLDVAANVYLQTGQLPQGMGKSASGLRSQVMNRATELSTGKPAADVAGGIVEAKQDVASRGKAVKDFSTGQQGKMVNSFNTAIDHLDTMSKLSDALQNGDIKAFNSLGNTIAAQTGSPAPTNFNAARQIVTTEVIKAINASGGGVTERQEAERNFASANSPEQLKGLIGTYQNLLGGQLKSLNLQYENTTGRKDFDKKLTPAAQSVVSRVRGETPAMVATPNIDALLKKYEK
jgi:hypothetical protein